MQLSWRKKESAPTSRSPPDRPPNPPRSNPSHLSSVSWASIIQIKYSNTGITLIFHMGWNMCGYWWHVMKNMTTIFDTPKLSRSRSGKLYVTIKSSNKYLQIFQQLKVPTDIYKSSNNKTVPTEIYKSSNKYLQIFQQLKVPTDIYKSSNKYLQIFQQISTNLPTINDTNKNLPVPPYTDPELPSTN